MSFSHWKVDVFQPIGDDPVFVKRDKYIKVSSNLTPGLILPHIIIINVEILCIAALII